MEKYQFSEEQLRLMELSSIPFAVYQFIDQRVVTLAASQGVADLLGLEDRQAVYDLLDHDMYRNVHPDDSARIADEAFRFATQGGSYNVVYRATVADSETYHVIHAMGSHHYTKSGARLAIVSYTDEGPYIPNGQSGDNFLSEYYNRELHADSFYRRNSYDYMTGLPNMSYFFELADNGRRSLRQQGRQPAILYFDLIGMKDFNRKYGFSEGDQLIRALSRAMTKQFANENCGRFGEDHFAVFADADGIDRKLENLFSAFREMYHRATLPVRVGIYLDNMGEVDINTACDRAKYACDVNRNSPISICRVFDEHMLEEVSRRQYIIDNIDRALQEGWIHVYHQPIVRTVTGNVSDEEALARWIDPEKGMLAPDQFIPVLEDARLIYKLDLFVLEQILQKMKKQEENGLYVVAESLNLSRVDFDVCDIVEEIRSRVDEAGIPREKITIEITESVVGKDFDFMKSQIARFRDLGFRVWMDDFGSGYSSLDLLQTIQFDVIKLDMRFMKQFGTDDRNRVILTELIRMAIGMGIDTVAEGVETEEQVQFLKEVGCTKLQGYYYCKPIPMETILERYRLGIQIGFENPAESEYYAAMGRLNLYDVSSVASNDDETLNRYFDVIPMAVLELDDTGMTLTRSNRSYRDFMQNVFGVPAADDHVPFSQFENKSGQTFVNALCRCRDDGKRFVFSEQHSTGTMVHTMIRRIAVNPVTGIAACAVVVLGISEDASRSITYTNIAQALSTDYVNLYYVNLETDTFIEYSSSAGKENMNLERHGTDFFQASRQDALLYIYAPDQNRFIETFTKENILRSLDDHGTFTLTYRLMIHDVPTYVNMKAVRMNPGSSHIIIGVNNVDEQMKQQEAMERLKEEQTAYHRINALSGDYIVIYTIDPETDQYNEYSAVASYEGFGLSKEGEAFFDSARSNAERMVYEEDRKLFLDGFTKKRVLRDIRDRNMFVMNYRLLMDGVPTYVSLKIAQVTEGDGNKLIAGVINIDEQVRRDREYAYTLAKAQNQANIDELTGVKNKHAYVDMEASLNQQIEDTHDAEFAVAVFDVNDLKLVNDRKGHQAGDAYLREGCSIICNLCKHSPVFRIGGDEFAVIAQGEDYRNIDALIAELEELNQAHKKSGAIVIACGMAKYEGDRNVSSVFDRADKKMYANKRALKQID